MFALIVNAFRADEKGKRKFGTHSHWAAAQVVFETNFNAKLFWMYFLFLHLPFPADFETAVTTALGTLGEKCSVQSRRYDDLDPFLFLPDEGFRQDYAAKQFDKVDMIFIGTPNSRISSTHHALHIYARFNSTRFIISTSRPADGDDNFLPWDPRLDQVRILMKMCLMTNKCTFACTFANHMFVYMYALVDSRCRPTRLFSLPCPRSRVSSSCFHMLPAIFMPAA